MRPRVLQPPHPFLTHPNFLCRSEPARDGGSSFNIEVTDTPSSRAGSLLQGRDRAVC
ncbi:hypothetical protein EMIT0P265_130125 [Pseudomonas zeae]